MDIDPACIDIYFSEVIMNNKHPGTIDMFPDLPESKHEDGEDKLTIKHLADTLNNRFFSGDVVLKYMVMVQTQESVKVIKSS